MEAFTAGSLLSFLATVPDPRSHHGRRHPLSPILALACCATMCAQRVTRLLVNGRRTRTSR